MQMVTYLSFNGDCEEAFQHYAAALGGKITFLLRVGESPMANQAPAAMKDKVLHATLQTPDGSELKGSDNTEAEEVPRSGFSVAIQAADLAQAQRMFKALSAGGRVQMELQKTFWSPGFGMCIDRFGIPWMVNCTAPA